MYSTCLITMAWYLNRRKVIKYSTYETIYLIEPYSNCWHFGYFM